MKAGSLTRYWDVINYPLRGTTEQDYTEAVQMATHVVEWAARALKSGPEPGRQKPVARRHTMSRLHEEAESAVGVDEAVLAEVVRRVVEVARPEKIILFGSAVHGRMGPHSDLDLLIIRSGITTGKLVGDIYMNFRGLVIPVDVIVVSPEDVERYGDSYGLVIREAMREGRVVYDAA